MKKVIVVGGGPAGMVSAIIAARNGHRVVLCEKNNKLGKKLFITGKGRCNITNDCDMDHLFGQVITNSKFLYSAFYTFSNDATIQFFNELGLKTKVERGNRVFPESDKSSDVIKVLEKELNKLGVEILLDSEVISIIQEKNRFKGICLKNNTTIYGDAVIIGTGGLSYAPTGSTGDGFKFAKTMGHYITKTSPSLVPLVTKENWIKDLQGLSLKNVKITINDGDNKLYEDFGEMLFTHFGVSGPIILSASRFILPKFNKNITLSIDLKPGLNENELDKRILKDFDKYQKKQFKNTLDDLLPKKLIPVIIKLSNIPEDKKISEITKEERNNLVKTLKALTCHIIDLRGYNEAIITYGGIDVKDIDPHTMESKLVSGVYFVGEVLDLDALTGGFNLQIAWSTGYLAGLSIN
ncbi:hypothetical protein EDC18_104154 [Natranaerovirga pectinivora]|uniref:NAD(P)/FAD-dependent oxidoreductase n=1 Tax=Natranaerovirga pectinivora TaxID=682400 RepID=A0A4R3MLL8_9FIRM|nr:NAD(P)/FAD-dependent oxidoreductase [Natranaerovirga pectinivora]TCT15004.1 hypothetical protein EDC18_104154 [Natranaerovirga pectinivora]